MARQRDRIFPTRDAIVAFIRAHPGKVGTREIAREFGLKNADRAELKQILRELADEGTIAKRGKKISEPAALPATVMVDITGRDSDGELIATPTEWDEVESGEPPKIRIHVPKRPQPGTAAGVGDRTLLRIEKLDVSDGAAYSGRIIKVVDHAKTRVLGIFRALPAGGGRLVPVDKKQAGRELNIAKADTGSAACDDSDIAVLDSAITALGHLADERGRTAVLRHVNHPSDVVRFATAAALPLVAGEPPSAEAVEALIRLRKRRELRRLSRWYSSWSARTSSTSSMIAVDSFSRR